MVLVYSEPLCRRHYAPIFGEAVLYKFLSHAGLIALSIVVAIATGGFWVKLSQDVGQATVHYTGDALLLVEGSSATETYIWSTSAAINNEFSSYYVPGSVQVAEEDFNYDGMPDIIDFYVALQCPTVVYSMKALLQVSYNLQLAFDIQMYGLAYITHSSSLPGGQFYADGELEYHQKNPNVESVYYNLYNTPMLSSDSAIGTSTAQPNVALEFQNILKSYNDRNFTTVYVNPYPVWKSGSSGTFEANIRIRIPPNQIANYRPNTIGLLKFAWIQFLATYIFLYFFYHWLEFFTFRYRLLNTTVVLDVKQPLQRF